MNELISYSTQFGVSTDTRTVQKGQVFFALKGPNFDGNKYAAAALERGASLAVVDDPGVVEGNNFLLVSDVLQTLQSIASAYRDTLKIPIIAICGSNGKTTTKELIYTVLSKKYKAFATKGNLNNHIGLPLSILSIPKDTEVAILEIGANHMKETAQLCEIAKPTHGIITNNGLDHLEGFGSIEGVIQANGELFEYLKKAKGYAFVNTLESTVIQQSRVLENVISFPSAGDYHHCKLIDSSGVLKIETETGKTFSTSMIGSYNFSNIAAALCIGKFFGVAEELGVEAVSGYKPGNNRSQLIERNGIHILLDAYNANPSSMKEAILSFSKMEYPKKHLILGDMLELGTYSHQAHDEILEEIYAIGFDEVILVGPLFFQFRNEFPSFTFYKEKESIPDSVLQNFERGSVVLLKGSRGMKMEDLERKIK